MLTKIKVRNYKGFKEAELPIKPITIMLGANSSGKSSIIQLLLILQQTAEEAQDSYKSALKIYGKRISIGKPENLFYTLDKKIPVHFKICFNNDKVYKNLQNAIQTYYLGLSSFYFRTKTFKEVFFKDRNLLREVLDNEFQNSDRLYYLGIDISDYILEQDIIEKDIESLLRNYDFLMNIRKRINSSEFSFSYNVKYYRKELIVSSFSLQQDNISIISYSEDSGFFSDIIALTDDDKDFLKSVFSKNTTIFNLFQKSQNKKIKKTSIGHSIISIVNSILSELRSEFVEPNINHVSPLRAYPQRYYMLDKANVSSSLDTYDANAIAEVIKEKPSLQTKVNDWLDQFCIGVNIEEFKEAIHKLAINQSGLSLDIPDVGFGISQVLPVVMQGFLSPNESVTIMEQPEIHLHPQMQGALADLFINIVKESRFKKHLIIETHSEYMLKRLRRRIAEEVISNDKVSINLFHARTEQESAIIENLPVEKRGAFKWPEELYNGELYEDVVKFLKLQ